MTDEPTLPCRRCRRELPADAFHRDRHAVNRQGRATRCRDCIAAEGRERDGRAFRQRRDGRPREKLQASIDAKLLAVARRYAARQGVSVSEVIERALAQELLRMRLTLQAPDVRRR